MEPTPEEVRDRENRRVVLHNDAVKTALMLNGGGIVALLTFSTQVILGDRSLLPLLYWIIGAIGAMVLGLLCAAPINHMRYKTSRLYQAGKRVEGKKLGDRHRRLFAASIGCIALGAILALAGLLWTIPSLSNGAS